MPSALPDKPAVPASVVTTPVVVIFRTVWLLESATKTLPAPSTATPWGPLKWAPAPVPSALPDKPAVPASVVTTPVAVIFRMVWLSESATKTLPAPSTATPQGS